MPDDNYKVYDRPSDGLVMIEASTETSIKQGIWAGLSGTSPGSTRAPRPLFEAAARRFLADTSRSHCVITDGYPIADAHFEFRYTCASSAPAR